MKLARLAGKPEIFYTIQGEGKSLGKPSIFVRTSLCNLHCVWCDTDYTWNWSGTRFSHVNDKNKDYQKFNKSEWIAEVSTKEALNKIRSFPCKNVVLTGGEPLLQQQDLIELAQELKKEGYWIEIETNGTLIPNQNLATCLDQFNVSPKLKNSNNTKNLRLKPAALKFFAKEAKSTFKFVIDTYDDLSEVLELIDNYHLRSEKVFLMPQGTTSDQLNTKRHWLVEICKNHGFNFTDRLHIHIWGNKKGV